MSKLDQVYCWNCKKQILENENIIEVIINKISKDDNTKITENISKKIICEDCLDCFNPKIFN